MAIHGITRQFPGSNLVISSIEHESVLAPARRYDYHEASVDMKGRLNLDDLRAKINDKTVLVSIMYANNEVGTVQPLPAWPTTLHIHRGYLQYRDFGTEIGTAR